jgi:AcrR family transcriptional regulator
MKTGTSRIADLRWARPVHQQRSQRTLQRLLDAGEAEIAEKGFEDASVADIAARAGCAVGTFYRRFRDKRALLHALDKRLDVEFRTTLDEAVDPARWEGAGAAEILEGYLEFALAVGRRQLGLRQAALLQSLSDPEFARRHARRSQALHERLRDLLLARRREIRHREPGVAVDFALEQLRAMLLARLEREPIACHLLDISDERFIREALRSVCSYLGTPPRPSGSDVPAGKEV